MSAIEFAMETREQELDQYCNMDYIWIILGLISGFRVSSGAQQTHLTRAVLFVVDDACVQTTPWYRCSRRTGRASRAPSQRRKRYKRHRTLFSVQP